jgi:hypothetical protein
MHLKNDGEGDADKRDQSFRPRGNEMIDGQSDRSYKSSSWSSSGASSNVLFEYERQLQVSEAEVRGHIKVE